MRVPIIILALVLLCPSSYAIGIFPSMVKMEFEPGHTETFYFTVTDSPSSKVVVHGSLAQYIKVSDTELINKDKFTATLTLPETIDTPGVNTGFIEVIEMKQGGQGMVAGVAAIEVPFYINVPYPGRYVTVGFSVPDANVNETVRLEAYINNLGTQNIETAFVDFEIKDINNKTIATLKSETKPVLCSKKSEFEGFFSTAGYSPGIYRAYADIHYDQEQKLLYDEFKIGSLSIELKNYTKEFYKDSINKFELEIRSGWNSDLKNIYADIMIKNATETVAQLKTPLADLERWQSAKLTTYWDTNGVGVGSYKAIVDIHYEGRTDRHNLDIYVVKQKEIESPSFFGSLLALVTNIYFIIIVLLLILFIVLLFLSRKRRKEGDKKSRKKN